MNSNYIVRSTPDERVILQVHPSAHEQKKVTALNKDIIKITVSWTENSACVASHQSFHKEKVCIQLDPFNFVQLRSNKF